MDTNTATYAVITHEGRFIVVNEDDNHFGDFATYEEALGRAEELEADLDAESERFGDHGVGDCWDEGRGDYDGDHATALASVYGEDW